MDPTKTNIPRRDFLQRTAAGLGTGLVLGVPNILRAADAKQPDAIHVALVGFGKQGDVLFNAMRNIPGLFFQAVCDIWPNSQGKCRSAIRAMTADGPFGPMPKGHMPKVY